MVSKEKLVHEDDVAAGAVGSTDELLLRSGAWDTVTPASAGWNHISFRVLNLPPGSVYRLPADGSEWGLVPLTGTISVEAEGQRWELGGRQTEFHGLGSCLYLPRDTAATVTALDVARIAFCGAACERRMEPALVKPEDVPVEIRGAGNASRQIGPLIPSAFPADRLHVIEVWTPGGNWSSFPPHKHERDREGETVLEETYFYRLRKREGFAMQRLYSPERGVDETWAVRDGDLLQIPWGYHTTVAAHGHDLYYLNVLAGPGSDRSLAAAEDPDLEAVKAAWAEADVDVRLPLVSH